MVVWPQRRRLLSDGRLSRHDVLFYPEAGRAAGLFLPSVDHPLLVADLPLHVGRPASSALYRLAGLDADARHDHVDHPLDALLGRHDQWLADALWRLG